jgi:hypothetical protein
MASYCRRCWRRFARPFRANDYVVSKAEGAGHEHILYFVSRSLHNSRFLNCAYMVNGALEHHQGLIPRDKQAYR